MSTPEHLDTPELALFAIRTVPYGERRTRVVVDGELDLLICSSTCGNHSAWSGT